MGGYKPVLARLVVAIGVCACGQTSLAAGPRLEHQVVAFAPSPPYWAPLADSIRASADSRHILYTLSNRDQAAVAWDGVLGTPYSQVVGPLMSPDSNRHA